MHDTIEPANDRAGVISAYQAQLNKVIALGTPQDVADCLAQGLQFYRPGGVPPLPTQWPAGAMDDTAAVLKKKSDGMKWAHRDLDKIAHDRIPAAWYGAAASSASAALSAVAGTADRISAALSPAAAALHTLHQQVDAAAAKDATGIEDLQAAANGLGIVIESIRVADQHSAQFLDADAELRPWYQKAQQAVQTRLAAATQAAAAASAAGNVFDQQAADLRAPGLYPDVSAAMATSGLRMPVTQFSGARVPANTLLSAADWDKDQTGVHAKTIVLTASQPGDPTEHRLLIENVSYAPGYGNDNPDPQARDAHQLFQVYDLTTGHASTVSANDLLSGQPVTTSGGPVQVTGVWIGD